MNIIIFGCGRTGAVLAQQLSKTHQVTVVEQNPEALSRLGYKHSCKVVLGSGLDMDTLEKAGIKNADMFFALTRGDNTNLMAGQMARMTFNVERVVMRVADMHRAEAYRKLGYVCLTPALLLAGMMVDMTNGDEYKPIEEYNQLPKEMAL
ncbi:MAG: TrkA family potassium uptake protein [Chthonomonas sp.]|nr:TrkA family potassium uptake protein [Chthonomonas sp.]